MSFKVKALRATRAVAVTGLCFLALLWFSAPLIGFAPLGLYWLWFFLELNIEPSVPASEIDKDVGSRQLIVAVRDLSLALSSIFSILHKSNMSFLPVVAGLVVYFLGLGVRLQAIRALGSNFSMTLTSKLGKSWYLVTDGIYGRLRHPGYLGLFLIYISWPMLVDGLAIALCVGVLSFGALIYRIRLEEAGLEQAFGLAYSAYRRRVPMLVPRISKNT